jgi:hypothetical protein
VQEEEEDKKGDVIGKCSDFRDGKIEISKNEHVCLRVCSTAPPKIHLNTPKITLGYAKNGFYHSR